MKNKQWIANKIGLLFVVLPIGIFANETMIKKTIMIEESIPATLMQTSFFIEKEGKDPSEVLKSFSATNKSILELTKKEDINCKGGQNRINPNYVYDGEKKGMVFNGYKGSVSYVCTFDKIESYNALLNASFDNGQRLRLSPIQWIITDEKKKEMERVSEQKLAKEALFTVQEYASLLDTKCSLKSLEIIPNSSRPLNMLAYAKSERLATSSNLENFQPTQDNVIVQLSGMIEILCQ